MAFKVVAVVGRVRGTAVDEKWSGKGIAYNLTVPWREWLRACRGRPRSW